MSAVDIRILVALHTNPVTGSMGEEMPQLGLVNHFPGCIINAAAGNPWFTSESACSVCHVDKMVFLLVVCSDFTDTEGSGQVFAQFLITALQWLEH